MYKVRPMKTEPVFLRYTVSIKYRGSLILPCHGEDGFRLNFVILTKFSKNPHYVKINWWKATSARSLGVAVIFKHLNATIDTSISIPMYVLRLNNRRDIIANRKANLRRNMRNTSI